MDNTIRIWIPTFITIRNIFWKVDWIFISLISISIGALLLYSIADFFFRDLVKNNLENKFSRYISIIKKNEFFYFFIFRFFGGLGVPFALQNTLPVIFNMNKKIIFLLVS